MPAVSVRLLAHEFGCPAASRGASVSSVVGIDECRFGLGQAGVQTADNGVLARRRPPARARCLALDRDDETRFPRSQLAPTLSRAAISFSMAFDSSQPGTLELPPTGTGAGIRPICTSR